MGNESTNAACLAARTRAFESVVADSVRPTANASPYSTIIGGLSLLSAASTAVSRQHGVPQGSANTRSETM